MKPGWSASRRVNLLYRRQTTRRRSTTASSAAPTRQQAVAHGSVSDERLAPVDLTVYERRHMTVTPELPQQRGGVPQDEEWLVGPVELGMCGIERSALRCTALRCPAGQLGSLPTSDPAASSPSSRRSARSTAPGTLLRSTPRAWLGARFRAVDRALRRLLGDEAAGSEVQGRRLITERSADRGDESVTVGGGATCFSWL